MKTITLITFTLINFHIIKEFGILFCLPPFLFYFYFFYKYLSINNYKTIIADNYYILIFIIISSFILLSLNVIFDSELLFKYKLLTLGRINFTYPIIILLIYSFDSINDYKKIINIYIAFNLIAAIFLIVTVIVDNNIFLQNDYFSFKVRDNLVRYSTLYGSVGQTGYALSLPIFILFMSNYSKFIKYIFLTILFIAVALSLSRAAYYNVILCFFIYLIINNKKTINEIILIFLTFFIITPLIMNILDIYNYYDYLIYKLFGYSYLDIEYTISKNTSDLINIYDRVYYSIFKEFYSILGQNTFSIQNLIFGYGYKFMGISLGLFNFNISNVMYIHNGFYEILLSSGIIIFCCFLSLFYLTIKNMISLIKINSDNRIIRIFAGSLLIIAINIFLGASIIHPNLIVFFWVITAFVVNAKKNNQFIA